MAVIEPGYFLTDMTQEEVYHENLQASWDHASPEIQELYGDNFLADCKLAVGFGTLFLLPIKASDGPKLFFALNLKLEYVSRA